MKKIMIPLLFILPFSPLSAAEDGWSGDGELGFTSYSGNTKSTDLFAKLSLANQMGLWKHELVLGANNNSSDNVRTAERYFLNWKSSRDFTPIYYGFGSFRYDKDRFSGFNFQSSLTAGIGMHVIKQKEVTLDTEIGLGYKVSETSLNDKTNEAVLIGGLFYKNQFTQTTRFTQDIIIEAASSNNYIESVTGLRVAISTQLALKASFTIKHNTDVDVGVKKTDTISALTLSYDF